MATSPFMALNAAWMRPLVNETVTGQGGTCFGDSGGPQLHGGFLVSITTAATTPARRTGSTSAQALATRTAEVIITRHFGGDRCVDVEAPVSSIAPAVRNAVLARGL